MSIKNHIDATTLYKLGLELTRFNTLEESLDFLVKELVRLLKLENAYFAIIGNGSLLIQSQYKSQDSIAEDFDLNINSYTDLNSGLLIKSGATIYLPIDIRSRLCAVLALIFQNDKEAQEIHSEKKELLETFSQEISQIINLSQTIIDLKSTNQSLLNQDRLKSQLISTISHELRTPMANIMGFSELLLSNIYQEETRLQYTKEIYDASLRLSHLINNFLDLSRIENGGELMFNNFEEVELDWLAERAWSHLGAINQKHEIQWHIASSLPEIFVDSEAITRVFINLFSNAIKYSPCSATEKKPISCFIEYKNNNNEILVSIKDSGIGMAEELLDSVFEKFYRIESQNTKHISGTGLGLWISKEILEAHGGRIWCESKLGEGSCFNFTLPLGVKKNVAKILLY